MSRLTDRTPFNTIVVFGSDSLFGNKARSGKPISNAIVRLAAYEDTEMEPEEIMALKAWKGRQESLGVSYSFDESGEEDK